MNGSSLFKSSSNIESNLFFHLVKRLMNKKDKDGESKNTMSVVVSKIVCTARGSGHTFSGMLKLIFLYFKNLNFEIK